MVEFEERLRPQAKQPCALRTGRHKPGRRFLLDGRKRRRREGLGRLRSALSVTGRQRAPECNGLRGFRRRARTGTPAQAGGRCFGLLHRILVHSGHGGRKPKITRRDGNRHLFLRKLSRHRFTSSLMKASWTPSLSHPTRLMHALLTCQSLLLFFH